MEGGRGRRGRVSERDYGIGVGWKKEVEGWKERKTGIASKRDYGISGHLSH